MGTPEAGPELPPVEVIKSVMPEYDNALSVVVGSDVLRFKFRFHVRVEGEKAKILAEYRGGSSRTSMDDGTLWGMAARRGMAALNLAKGHLLSQHANLRQITINPESFVIGNKFVVWDREQLDREGFNTEESVQEEERKKAMEIVIGMGAFINNHQFEMLSKAIGEEVVIDLIGSLWKSSVEEFDEETSQQESITLNDFRYVVDEATGKRYLAYLRLVDAEGPRLFPLVCDETVGTICRLKALAVRDRQTSNLLWWFDRPEKEVLLQTETQWGLFDQVESVSVSARQELQTAASQ